MKVDLGYNPRPAFVPFHLRKERFAVVVAHRRAGKTVAAIRDMIDYALRCEKPDGRFAYVAPYYAQAKDVVWLYLKGGVSGIPGVRVNESELRVDLPNGARVRLYGADNYDRMRGLYFDGVVLDEYADMPPAAWREVIRPALADRQGWAVFIGTPKGRNAFADLYESAVADPAWFSLRLRASETGIIPQEELDALRSQMSENEYRREMETDFDAAVEGAYYGDALNAAEREGRIGNVSADPLMSLRAYWDIGGTGAKADACAIWIAQFVGREVRVLDYYESVGQPLAVHVQWLRGTGYGKAEMILPHDGVTHDRVHDATYEGSLRSAGFSVQTIPNQGPGAAMQRIESARRLLPSIWFNRDKTAAGRAALAHYHEHRDGKRNIGLGVHKDWSNHAADAFGLMCICYKPPSDGWRPLTYGTKVI